MVKNIYITCLYWELRDKNANDDEIKTVASSAMTEMKRMFWKGTEHWDQLLIERAAISGRLVLSEFSRNAIRKFTKK